MKDIFIGSAAVAALTLAFNAHAGCADPRGAEAQAAIEAQPGLFEHMPVVDLQQRPIASHLDGEDAGVKAQNASQAIVGTWIVVYTPEGSTTPSGKAFIQWHSDNTEWENIDYPVLGGNICLGSWTALDQSHVSRNHYGWLYNNGVLAGYFDENETDEVASDGNSYTGTNTTILYFLSGPPMTLKGTAAAKRLTP
jgi:hypothetical protein